MVTSDRASNWSRSARSLGIALGIGLILTACGVDDPAGDAEAPPPPDAGDRPSNVVIAISSEPPNYDYTQTDALAVQVALMYNVLEPLLEQAADGSFQPLLAESFEVSDDGLEYLFTVREAQFHNGNSLTADDVVYSLELNRAALNTAVSGPLEPVEAVEQVDERTVKVTLSAPSQQFLHAMSRDSGFIIPEDSEDQLQQSPIGTGPFAIDEWRHGVELNLAKFDDYWGEPPFFERVTWRLITEPTAAVNALLAGDVDMIDEVFSLDQIAGIDDAEGLGTVTQTAQGMGWVLLNAGDELFSDVRVRQAIAHAIDREAINDGAYAGLREPTCVAVNPPDVAWSSEYCPYPYDPERSRQLLAEAGADGLTIEVKTVTLAHFPVITEILTAQLADVGVTVENRPVDLATWLEEVPRGDYQLSHIEGSQQIDSFVCPGSWVHDCVPEFDGLLEDADASTDPDQWAALRQQAVEFHADRAYLIPIANNPVIAAVRDDLEGVKPFRAFVEQDVRSLRWEE